MGQRLNIEIMENGKVLANSYYHWSGYTSSSFETTQEVLNKIVEVSHKNRVINAVKLLEVTGAGLSDEEKAYLLKKVKSAAKISFAECRGRNDGLIAVSPNGIKETECWEEARVIIDLTSRTVNFGAVHSFPSKEDFEKAYDEECSYPVHDDIDFENIPFDNLAEISKDIGDLVDKRIYGFQTPQGTIWTFIE